MPSNLMREKGVREGGPRRVAAKSLHVVGEPDRPRASTAEESSSAPSAPQALQFQQLTKNLAMAIPRLKMRNGSVGKGQRGVLRQVPRHPRTAESSAKSAWGIAVGGGF